MIYAFAGGFSSRTRARSSNASFTYHLVIYGGGGRNRKINFPRTWSVVPHRLVVAMRLIGSTFSLGEGERGSAVGWDNGGGRRGVSEFRLRRGKLVIYGTLLQSHWVFKHFYLHFHVFYARKFPSSIIK